MRIPRALIDDVIEHARAEAPNECVGVITVRDGVAQRVIRATNAAASPLRYEIHPDDLYAIYTKLEDAGEEMGVLFHTHPKTEAAPSQTDVNMNTKIAEVWGPMTWLIGSLAGGEFVLRGFDVDSGRVEEIALDVG